jgi:hypothetical protein
MPSSLYYKLSQLIDGICVSLGFILGREKRVLGGSSILSYIYMVEVGEPFRLTFDLDTSWYRRVLGKRVALRR